MRGAGNGELSPDCRAGYASTAFLSWRNAKRVSMFPLGRKRKSAGNMQQVQSCRRSPVATPENELVNPLTYVLITPARNEADFIELTLKSVVSQTVRPLKWVIVSDGSTDGMDG